MHSAAPEGDVVHVWHARLAAGGPSQALLSADEQARAARLVRSDVRARFEAGRGALRRILASYLGCAPADVPLSVGASGKPALTPGHSLMFNASHTADHLVVAVASRPVGIDLETLDARISAGAIAARYFSPDEAAAIDTAAPSGQALAAFIGVWTRKEAVLKALGAGLTLPLRSFSVSVPPEPARIMSADDARLAPGQWALADLAPMTGRVGVVALAGTAVALEEKVFV